MLGIGKSLKQARKEQGLSLKEMKRKTNIQIDYLQWLEAERYDLLPSPFYARGFLRSYAKSLKLDSDYLLDLYDGKKTTKEAAIQAVSDEAKELEAKEQEETTSETTELQSELPPRAERKQADGKATMVQIETFAPRGDVKKKSKDKKGFFLGPVGVLAILATIIFILVGFIYIGYK
jgi:transcriptional regulator with XRE-family HTH domain